MIESQTYVCPCCGQDMPTKPSKEHLTKLNLSALQEVLVDAMLDRYPRTLLLEELIDRAYVNARGGGPLNASQTILTTLANLRKKLEPAGWTVSLNRGGRGRSRYTLEPLN